MTQLPVEKAPVWVHNDSKPIEQTSSLEDPKYMVVKLGSKLAERVMPWEDIGTMQVAVLEPMSAASTAGPRKLRICQAKLATLPIA